MPKSLRWVAGCVLLAGMLQYAAGAATLDYQGRIAAGGADFTGKGHFKFMLHDGKGRGLWSNDGTFETAGGPKGAVPVEVSKGLFAVQLGEETGGMKGISPLAFHAPAVLLRTWFSTNSAGPFEQLAPDVAIHTPDLAHFDTGAMIVVDAGGKGDVRDLQEAVNTAATNPAFSAVLIMPGTYVLSKPLTVPAGRKLLIRGTAREWVSVENAKGAALVPFDGAVEGISFRGSPALGDAGAAKAYALDVRRCTFTGLKDGAGAELGRDGSVTAFESAFESAEGGSAIALQNFAGSLALESCRIESGGGKAVVATGGSGQASFAQCRVTGGVEIVKAGLRLRATSSAIVGSPPVLLGTSGDGAPAPEIIGCELTGPVGQPAVGLGKGVPKGAVRMFNTVLSAEPDGNVTLLPPSKSLPQGNVVR